MKKSLADSKSIIIAGSILEVGVVGKMPGIIFVCGYDTKSGCAISVTNTFKATPGGIVGIVML